MIFIDVDRMVDSSIHINDLRRYLCDDNVGYVQMTARMLHTFYGLPYSKKCEKDYKNYDWFERVKKFLEVL